MLWHLQQVFVPSAVSLGLHIHQGQLYTMEGIFIILSHWVIMYHQGVLERGLAKQFVHNLLHQSRLRGADVNEWKSNSVVQHLDCSWSPLHHLSFGSGSSILSHKLNLFAWICHIQSEIIISMQCLSSFPKSMTRVHNVGCLTLQRHKAPCFYPDKRLFYLCVTPCVRYLACWLPCALNEQQVLCRTNGETMDAWSYLA